MTVPNYSPKKYILQERCQKVFVYRYFSLLLYHEREIQDAQVRTTPDSKGFAQGTADDIPRHHHLYCADVRHLGTVGQPSDAILTRSSVFSFSEILIACRKLKKTVSFNLVFSLISSVIGVAIMYFLASNGEYGAASPVNALIYFACWLLPVWFISIVFTAF